MRPAIKDAILVMPRGGTDRTEKSVKLIFPVQAQVGCPEIAKSTLVAERTSGNDVRCGSDPPLSSSRS